MEAAAAAEKAEVEVEEAEEVEAGEGAAVVAPVVREEVQEAYRSVVSF